ncbi:helix-turn-helix domain-containing protein [Azonexus sp. IMCC34842]|uniref:helix-turn-helix domain-containing protein n=1 Tax=Azonexus sp. IMCC34842 TaxID=3420950 RepID=UPI003D13C5C7
MPQTAASSYSFQNRTTRDSDEHAEALQDWDQVYDQLSPGNFEGKVVDLHFKGLQIFRETTNRSVSQHGSSWDGCFVVGIPISMNGTGLFSKQVLTRDSMLTFHSDQEFSLTTPEGFDVVAVAIPEATLLEAMNPDSQDQLRHVFPKSPTVMVTAQGQLDELRNCLLSIFDPASFEPALLRYPQVQRAMSSAIIGHLAEVLHAASHAPLPNRSFRGRCQVVKEATHYALSHTAEPITVADLCQKLNISRRMLNYCFQDALATNPVHYLRSLRLNGVRRDLRQPLPAHTQIRDIAGKWGFWHLPRFAAEYRALFGELPSETARNCRH